MPVSSSGSCPTAAASLAPLPDPQGPSAGRGGTCRGHHGYRGRNGFWKRLGWGGWGGALVGQRLRAGLRSPPLPTRPVPSPPSRRSRRAPSATSRLARASPPRPVPVAAGRGGEDVLLSPCASPRPARPPGGRSSGGDRLTRHRRTCSSSSAAKVPEGATGSAGKPGGGR